MNIHIEITNNTLERLQKLSVPLIDTPDTIINKLIDKTENNSIVSPKPSKNIKPNRYRTKTPTPSCLDWVDSVPELRHVTGLNTWKSVCKYLGIDTGGDSARRKLKKWAKRYKPEWLTIPEPK